MDIQKAYEEFVSIYRLSTNILIGDGNYPTFEALYDCKFRDLLVSSINLFSDEFNINVSLHDSSYSDIEDLPEYDNSIVTVALDVKPLNIKCFNSEKMFICHLINTTSRDEDIDMILKKERYIIKGRLYSTYRELVQVEKFEDFLFCIKLIETLYVAADYREIGGFALIGGVDRIVQYSKTFNYDDIASIKDNSKNLFFSVMKGNNEILKQIFKSTMNNKVRSLSSPMERTSVIFKRFDEIMKSYEISMNQYLRRFSEEKLFKHYSDFENNIHAELGTTIQKIKSELIVYLSMYFALAGINLSNTIFVNILITIGILFMGMLGIVLLSSDKKLLAIIKARIILEIDKIGATSLRKDFYSRFVTLKNLVDRNSKWLTVAQFSIAIPFIIACINTFHASISRIG